MKILIATDLHIHTWKSFDEDRNTLLSKQTSIQDDILNHQIYKLIVDNEVKFFLCGGDWFQNVNQIPVECLNIVQKFLTSIRSLGVIDESVTGNHDLVKRVNPQWFQNVVNVFRNPNSTRSGNIFEVDGVKIGFINYEDEVDYDKFVGLDIVFAHKTPAGAVYCQHVFNDGIDWKRLSDNNRLVFFGHIHQRQELSPNCIVIGPPMLFNFGETGDRGVYIIDTDIWSVEFIKLEYPEFRTVEYIEQVIDDYNYYRVLNSDTSEIKDNAIIINKPRVFDERIKSEGIHNIASDWININGKDGNCIKLVEEQLNKVESRFTTVKDYVLTEVEIEDFISIGKIEYFVNGGFTLISGKSESFSSNGSGKTAVVDAIYYTLFGKTTKGLTGDDVVRRGQKDCNVGLKLQGKDQELYISRSRKSGLSINKMFNGMIIEDLTAGLKQQDRQQLLEQILGFNESLYMSSCYFSQESLMMLTDMSDVDRTNMVSSLLGFNIYDELYTWVSETLKFKQTTVVDLEKSKSQYLNKIETTSSYITMVERNVAGENDSIQECHRLISGYESKIKELSVKVPDVGPIDNTDYDSKIDELKKEEVVVSNVYIEITSSLKLKTEEKSLISSKLASVQTRAQILKSELSKIKHKIDDISNLKFDTRCEVCGSLVTQENSALFISELNNNLESKEKELNGFVSEISVFDSDISNIMKEIQKSNILQRNTEDELSMVRKEIQKCNYLKISQIEAKNRLDKAKELINSDIREYETLIKSYKTRIDDLMFKISKHKLEIEGYKTEIDNLKLQLSNIEQNFNVLNDDLQGLEFWKVAFSPKGIKSLLLDKFCNDINSIINNCLSIVSNGSMSITITPTATTKAGEERNKLGIEISMGGTVVKYESLSGGEKRRVDFSLCMSLNQYISTKFNLSSGLLGLVIMDELFSYLDRSGEELIGQYLVNFSKSRSIFVITHTDELTSYADRYWTVVKENNISRLEVN